MISLPANWQAHTHMYISHSIIKFAVVFIIAFLFRFMLPEYYEPESLREFVCSDPEGSGMAKCSNLPRTVLNSVECNLTADLYDQAISNLTCVNWNQYYTSCRPSGPNPFHGGISFDNIGLAWVAIFQVSMY